MGNCLALCTNSWATTVSAKKLKTGRLVNKPILAKNVHEEAQSSEGSIAFTKKACNLLNPSSILVHKGGGGGGSSRLEESDTEQTGSTRRIKVIITKQQLQNLLSNQVLVEDIFSLSAGPHTAATSSTKPRLHPIPEETELLCSIL